MAQRRRRRTRRARSLGQLPGLVAPTAGVPVPVPTGPGVIGSIGPVLVGFGSLVILGLTAYALIRQLRGGGVSGGAAAPNNITIRINDRDLFVPTSQE
jgi:hypothetical protein